MRTVFRRILVCFTLTACFWVGTLLADAHTLRRELVRLHVVARSDSGFDQQVKLSVRDAVTGYLKTALEDIADVELAKQYIQENLPKIQAIANETLESLGVDAGAVATFCREEFGKRVYDTFTLPAGIYDSLRITIGEGEGKNWWCVVFPTLCFSASAEEFDSIATGAGFSESLTGAITGEDEYEVRFFFLDALGHLENFLHREN